MVLQGSHYGLSRFLRRFNKSIIGERGLQLFCHGEAVRSFLSHHDNEIVLIEQNTEVVFNHELPGRCPDVHAVLSLSIRIPP